jgi:hypothetical protein
MRGGGRHRGYTKAAGVNNSELNPEAGRSAPRLKQRASTAPLRSSSQNTAFLVFHPELPPLILYLCLYVGRRLQQASERVVGTDSRAIRFPAESVGQRFRSESGGSDRVTWSLGPVPSYEAAWI